MTIDNADTDPRKRLCLVTGGSGFIGSHVVEALLAVGARVRVPVHRRPMPFEDARVEVVAADLARPGDCRAVMADVEWVVHAAGSVGAAGVGPGAMMAGIALNLTLTANVLEAAWSRGVDRVLVFGSGTGYPLSEAPMAEEALWSGPVPEPYFGYGWMRRYMERLAEFMARSSSTRATIVRPSAVYGPRDNFDPRTGHVIPALIRRAVARETPFVVWGAGTEVRDFLHVADFARGCVLALRNKADADPVNIAAGSGVTIALVAGLVLEVAEHRVEPIFDPDRPVTVPVRRLDIGKARRELGFEPAIGLREGLAETCRWYVDNRRILDH